MKIDKLLGFELALQLIHKRQLALSAIILCGLDLIKPTSCNRNAYQDRILGIVFSPLIVTIITQCLSSTVVSNNSPSINTAARCPASSAQQRREQADRARHPGAENAGVAAGQFRF
jgi:hypothetical protein